MSQLELFATPGDPATLETSDRLSPRFDADGLIACITTDADSGEVLMFAWMNREALAETIATRRAVYYSRSRRRLWRKGEESGNVQTVAELRIDCDQDAVLMKVRMGGEGAACHTGRRSCFYREIELGSPEKGAERLHVVGGEPLFDPAKTYGKTP